jgi:hypothetical protein
MTKLNEIDKAALDLAMEIARREPGRGEQLDAKLKEESWFEVATFAAYCVQTDSLNLKPWESPPCEADEDADLAEASDYGNVREAQQLLRQMLAAGVSRWHPDPIRALEVKKVN